MMQGAGFVYVLLLLGAVCPSLFTIGKQAEGEAPGTAYANASAYVADSIMEKPKIAITFDDGPSAVYTPRLLDGLKERGVKATFFLIGQNIEKEGGSEIVKRMYEEGHLIGNHTYHHVEITKVSNDEAYQELMLTNEAIENITGEEVQFMRPPFGLWQKELEKKIHVLPVMWSIDPLDWATENVDEIVNKVVTEAQENDIILLHDCYDSSVKAALRIIDLLQAEGYEFVTVDELMLD
ncbi:polysaccharide deacetylase family protein [Faecalicatena contorta]|nr:MULTISPECIES: polysaccharide deacetylase family protein [Lachnospiraceae]